jgi:hypothetical protein
MKRQLNNSRQSSPSNMDDENSEDIINNRRLFNNQSINNNLSNDDKTINSFDIFKMSTEERNHYINNYYNALGYPKEYYDIYMKEKLLRNPIGYQECLNITNTRLFIPNADQQFSKQIYIKNIINPNCIKSESIREMDLSNFNFSDEFKNLIYNKTGINIGQTFEQFKESNYSILEKSIANLEIQRDEYLNKIYNEMNKTDRNDPLQYQLEQEEDSIVSNYAKMIEDETIEFNRGIEMEYENLYKNSTPTDILTSILLLLRSVFDEYKDNIVVAGGFALSYYTLTNYGYITEFDDIDIFIHSCDENTANKIAQRLNFLTKNNVYENDNVVLSYFAPNSIMIKYPKKHFSIQIIKRLYISPSQVIHGFDIDSSCILVNLDAQIWTTQRGAYSIKKGYNVVNFDRLSPSYEYRLIKYRQRGIAIWIPQIEYFKQVVLFDVNVLKRFGSGIIIKYLVKDQIKLKDVNTDIYTRYTKEISDYNHKYYNKKFNNDSIIKFKTLNPGKQIINTFHRTVLKDIIEWYPIKYDNVIDNLDDINKLENPNEFVNVSPNTEFNYILAKNIIRRKRLIIPNIRNRDKSRELLNYIQNITNNIYVIGDLPKRALTGISNPNVKLNVTLWGQNIDNYTIYNIFKYRALLGIRETFFRDTNHLPNGRFVFTPISIKNKSETTTYEKLINITEEESFENFNINLEKYDNTVIKFKKDRTKKQDIKSPYSRCIMLSENRNDNYWKYNNCYFIPNINESNHINTFDIRERHSKCNINFSILNENTSLDKHLISLDKYDDVPPYIYYNNTLSVRKDEYMKTLIGIAETENIDILPYPVYQNFIPYR